MAAPLSNFQDQLRAVAPDLAEKLLPRDSAARLLEDLPQRFTPADVAVEGASQRVWELVGLSYLSSGRPHEALGVFAELYQQMLLAQDTGARTHKGLPLCWMADCCLALGFRSIAKRYMMLTLCEDAIRGCGAVSPEGTGSYFRLVWQYGLSDAEFRRYASEFWEKVDHSPETKLFPEALLQQVDNAWSIEPPSTSETYVYQSSRGYVRRLLDGLGGGDGVALEMLAEYLLSCVPGCRTARRKRSGSTDYDVVCSLEGPPLDFRAELVLRPKSNDPFGKMEIG